jgi:hypothetical protein
MMAEINKLSVEKALDKLRAGDAKQSKDALFNDKIDVLREEIERMRTPRFETTIASMLLLSQRHLSVGTMTVRAIVRGRALVVGC